MAVQITQARSQKTNVTVTSDDRERLTGVITNRNTPAKVVWQARIVLAKADGKCIKPIGRVTETNLTPATGSGSDIAPPADVLDADIVWFSCDDLG